MTSQTRRIRFVQPDLTNEDIQAVVAALRANHLGGNGAVGQRVQARLRGLVGTRHALLTTSCSHALEIVDISDPTNPVHAGKSAPGHGIVYLPVTLAIDTDLRAGIERLKDADSRITAGYQVERGGILLTHKIEVGSIGGVDDLGNIILDDLW